jgi:hypothetical protein
VQHKELTLQITWACDIRCAHCNQDHLKTDLDVASAQVAMTRLAVLGEINRYSFTGGEPFLRWANMLALARHGAALGLPFGVITNARWAKTATLAQERLGALHALGMDMLVVSYDPFHQAFVPETCVTNVLDAARQLDVPIQVYVSRADLTPIGTLSGAVAARFGLAIEQVPVRDVVPLGHGAALGAPAAVPYAEVDKTCPVPDDYNLWPDGEVLPCCSAGTHPDLSLGNLYNDDLDAIVARRHQSPLLAMIHQHGLGEIIIRLPPPIRDRLASDCYVSACHLCYALAADPAARAAAEQLDASAIGLIEKLLLSPALEAALPAPKPRRWKGPPVVSGG